jgi:hypothetical protein
MWRAPLLRILNGEPEFLFPTTMLPFVLLSNPLELSLYQKMTMVGA